MPASICILTRARQQAGSPMVMAAPSTRPPGRQVRKTTARRLASEPAAAKLSLLPPPSRSRLAAEQPNVQMGGARERERESCDNISMAPRGRLSGEPLASPRPSLMAPPTGCAEQERAPPPPSPSLSQPAAAGGPPAPLPAARAR